MNQARREELFRQWISEHRGILVKVARSFTTSPADTDDLIQEILIRVWASIDQYRGESKPSTWIYRVALNRAISWQRDAVRRSRETPSDELRHVVVPDNAEDQHRVNQLYEHIRQLSKIDRCLVLLSLDGFSYAELSAITAISESNVGARLTRARKELLVMIEKDNQ